MYNLTHDITFIGADDDNLDLFEAQYPLVGGISYNSYIINDEKVAIMDAVDVRRMDTWLANIEDWISSHSKTPDYIIIHHMEPDHSGGIRSLLSRFPNLKLVCTAKAADMLMNFFEDIDFSNSIMKVGNGDILNLGKHELKFLTAPMVHWPEVMMTLDLTEKILFTSDAFGSFAMSGAADEAWPDEARRYYANIVGRFGPSVQTILKKLAAEHVELIAPLHGPVIRENLASCISLYDKWSRYEAESDGVFVAYASIYGGTAEAAQRLASILRSKGATEVTLFDLCRHDVSYAVAFAWKYSRIVLCSATYDADVFPSMHNFLHHLEQKKLANRTVGLIENGSWAPVAANVMRKHLENMKNISIVEPVVSIRSRLHKSDITTLNQLADAVLNPTNPE